MGDFWKNANQNVKVVVYALGGLAGIGLILLLVGAIVLAIPNTRADDIKEFNAAVDAWNAYGKRNFDQSSFYVRPVSTSYSMSKYTVDVPFQGNLEDVNTNATSMYVQRTGVTARDPMYFVVNSNGTQYTLSKSISLSKKDTGSIWCWNKTGCLVTVAKCSSIYSFYDGNYTCSYGGLCGYCWRWMYLSTMCTNMYVSSSTGRWVMSSKQGCAYPFSNSHVYTTVSSSTITVRVRSTDDPYIVLQSVTSGSNDFGMTEEEQHSTGVALIAVGAVMCVCSLVGLGYYVYTQKQKMSHNGVKSIAPQPA